MENLFILSGIRGNIQALSSDLIEKVVISYGLWLKDKNCKKVILGQDTRESSNKIRESVIRGLLKVECQIYDVGICPSPIIIFTKKRLAISGGIIITGSQNPPDINGLRFLSQITYVNNYELKKIRKIAQNLNYSKFKKKKVHSFENIIKVDAIPEYTKSLYSRIPVNLIKKENNLKILIDTGAGTAKFIIPELLKDLGCEVKLINNEFTENSAFPREMELDENNLKELVKKVWEEKADLGIAYDINTHRLRIVGNDYKCYEKDMSLALIAEYYAKRKQKPLYFITNIASSLRLDILAKKYNFKLVKTAIGESFLAIKMNSLIKESSNAFVFGGEGSNGGVMIPEFNNTRDAIYATIKIIELLIKEGKKISSIVSSFPAYYRIIENINIKEIESTSLINEIKQELISEGESVFQIGNNLRIDKKNKNFVLFHPSQTASVIRIIAEAKRKSLARILCQTNARLVQMIIKKNESSMIL
ncbi:MAG: hypothetical protein EU547_05400 [Promethearchaeota archaeon]|nr:MAG: hypothetical protein EU547_05400 [Candidatus Lokiarchaeota archaeon]